MVRTAILALLLFILVGCYAATVETGLKPSSTVIKQSFATSWIYGLVPPKTVYAASQCPNGVAKVETQLSFVNQLVGFITFGIYTPMQIIVTCAESNQMGELGSSADIILSVAPSQTEVEQAFTDAASKSAELGRPVYVKFNSEDVHTSEAALNTGN
jgi:Bor protein